ncbi:protein translocase subunit secA [Azotobacter beijerinckii]|uniref:Protein translocase subunit SecA n=1 Tax=Azotobacter beijerinckii TaxID=170623 RepID=A0A1H9S1V9_9GAMM|nr:protein translocase subunit secA [Azotobacter beijerinckii]
MSDVRALLAGRAIDVADGAYPERAEQPVHAVEDALRALVARFTGGTAKRSGRFVRQVNALEDSSRAQDDDGLRSAMYVMAKRMQQEGFREELVAQAFALVREASRRVLGMRHHDVQLLAGQALLQGRIAEMATGEGKTLAATLAVCTAAVAGSTVHVVTINDYLAERDAEDNAPLYAFFGLSLGIVKQDMPIEERRARYARDVVYVSNKELAFDYLKDRIALGGISASQLKLRRLQRTHSAPVSILRGLHVAIVDEADSVLVDEARTPLIISETLPDELGRLVYHQAITVAGQLEPDFHFLQNHDRDIWLTPAGEAEVVKEVGSFEGVWKSPLWQKELVGKALSALHLFHRDQHYIIADDKVQIVDEFTGRVMPDRTWERGLHQMIEAKENCEITGQRRTLSQITYQRFFGRYLLLAGMTGTAKEVEPELKRVYDLSVTRIPTHKPPRRQRLPDRVFRTSAERWEAVAHRAHAVAAQGRAVLVGTRSVEASELLSRLLEAQGVAHTVLNARQDKAEAEAVAKAGQSGQITVATNMAGRGTDIKLAAEVEQRGGLHVILTEFHESARVDRQLFGRSARQGNPGSVEVIVSLDDSLLQRYVPRLTRMALPIWGHSNLTKRWLFRCLVVYAQSKAEVRDRQSRLDTIKLDHKWLRALGFVGAHKK